MPTTGQYFPHQHNAHDDEKLQRVIMEQGLEGYAIFFLLLELLGQTKERELTKEYYKVFAWNYHVDVAKVQQVVENYGLFEINGNNFRSNGLIDRMKILDEKIAKRRAAGALGGKQKAENLKQNSSNASQNSSKTLAMLEEEPSNASEDSSKSLAIKGDKEEKNNKEKNTTNKDKSLCCVKKEREQHNNTTVNFNFDERIDDFDFLAIVSNYMKKYAIAPADEAYKLIDMMHPEWKGKYSDYMNRKPEACGMWQCPRDRKYMDKPRATVAECRMIGLFIELVRAANIYNTDVLNAYRGMNVSEGNIVTLCFSNNRAVELIEQEYISKLATVLRKTFGTNVQLEYRISNEQKKS